MSVSSSFIDYLEGVAAVSMPPRANPFIIARGVEAVLDVIAENKRKEEERRLAAEEERRRKLEEEAADAELYDSGCRFSIARSPEDASRRCSIQRIEPYRDVRWSKTCYKTSPCPSDFIPLDMRKRPPDLNAKVLTFSARLVKYVNERYGGRAPIVYKRVGVDRKLYSKIVSDNNASVSKPIALQLAIGLQLNRKEAEEFIGSAGFTLSNTIPMDYAFLYCIENGIWNILDVNEIVTKSGCSDLKIKY